MAMVVNSLVLAVAAVTLKTPITHPLGRDSGVAGLSHGAGRVTSETEDMIVEGGRVESSAGVFKFHHIQFVNRKLAISVLRHPFH